MIYKKDDPDLAIKINELLKELRQEIRVANPAMLEAIMESGAYVVIEDSMLELIKNSIDAEATKLDISLRSVDKEADTLSFDVIDNGHGFPAEMLGRYPTSKEAVGASPKLGDTSKRYEGGANIGLLQASVALDQNKGALVLRNVGSDTGKIIGAKLIFSSSLRKCVYRVTDYQINREDDSFSRKTSRLTPEKMIGMLGSSFNEKFAAARLRRSLDSASPDLTSSFASDARMGSYSPLVSGSFGGTAQEVNPLCPLPSLAAPATPSGYYSEISRGELPGCLQPVATRSPLVPIFTGTKQGTFSQLPPSLSSEAVESSRQTLTPL